MAKNPDKKKEQPAPVTVEQGREVSAPGPAGRALSPFEEMQHEMDHLFDAFFPRGWLRPLRWDMPRIPELKIPKVDIIERDEEIVVRAEVPGIDKNNIDVSVTESSITIKGHQEEETKEEKGNFHRSEIRRGSFYRTLALPVTVDSEKAKANFKDGVLEITLPKTVKAKRRSITID